MITFTQQISNPILHWPSRNSGPKILNIKTIQVATSAIKRSEIRRERSQQDEILMMKLRLRMIFNMIKNCASSVKAKIMLAILLIDLFLSGLPLEDFIELLEELIKEIKKDQVLCDFVEELIPLLLEMDE